MPNWTKESAFKELSSLIDSVDGLMRGKAFSTEHMRWYVNTLNFIEEVFGQNSAYYGTLRAYPWHSTGTHLVSILDPEREMEHYDRQAYVQQMESAKGVLLAARDELEQGNLEDVYRGKDTPAESSLILQIINLAERKIRKAIRSKPSGEKEVQDVFEALLLGAGIEYAREVERIEYSSKTYVPDFTVRKIELTIEIKLCSETRKEKDLIAEINDDILAYQSKYCNNLFVVYDLGCIRDVDRFAASFEKQKNVVVRIVKH